MKYSKLLDYDISSFDFSRYYKQLKSVAIWKANKGQAALSISGGIGKTLIGIIAIKKMQKRDPSRTAIVVVPTEPLKSQWEKELIKFNIKSVNVYIINTALLLQIKCNLLILDEYHLFMSKERIKILNIPHNWRLGLSGTPERLDNRHEIMNRYLPIVYNLGYHDGVKLGYIMKVKVFNLAIPLNITDTIKLNQLSKQLNSAMKYFGNFDQMMNCLKKSDATAFAESRGLDPKKTQKNANFGNFAMRERMTLLRKSNSKVNEVINIINIFKNNRILTFGLHTDLCDYLTEQFPKEAISYHSNIKNEIVKVKKEEIRKTEKGALTLKSKHLYSKISKTDEGYKVSWLVNKSLTKEETLNNILNKFVNDRSNLRIINTALCLKQGISINELDLILDYARSSSFADFDQKMWRLVRIHEGKIPIMINLYHPNTQDEKWLKNAQRNLKDEEIIWIEDVTEINNYL